MNKNQCVVQIQRKYNTSKQHISWLAVSSGSQGLRVGSFCPLFFLMAALTLGGGILGSVVKRELSPCAKLTVSLIRSSQVILSSNQRPCVIVVRDCGSCGVLTLFVLANFVSS